MQPSAQEALPPGSTVITKGGNHNSTQNNTTLSHNIHKCKKLDAH